MNRLRGIGRKIRTQPLFERRGGLRKLENLHTPSRQDRGDEIVILLGDEFVGASANFAQDGINPPSLYAIWRMQMKGAGSGGFFLGKRSGERLNQTRRKKGQRDSLAVLKKLAPADRGLLAIVLRPAQRNCPLRFPKQKRKSSIAVGKGQVYLRSHAEF